MKINLRIKKAIIQAFVLNLFFLLLFLSIVVFSIIPRQQQIGDLKNNLYSVKSQISSIEKTGIPFADFKEGALAEGSADSYTKTLLRNATEEFYTSKISNSQEENFSKHIELLNKEISEFKSSQAYIQREKSVENILPIYTLGESQGLTELDFINYIERILYTFNLSRQGEIGIGQIEKFVENINNTNNSSDDLALSNIQESLEENIFFIPLTFQITGQKKDIFDLLHFFENVGNISYSEESIVPYSDSFLKKNLYGNTSTQSNIYESQIADISLVSLSEYPDSSTYASTENADNLIELISQQQAKEKYSIELGLRFFVSGLPGYSMEEYITSTIQKYETLEQDIVKSYNKAKIIENTLVSGKQIQALGTLKELNRYISSLSSNVLAFKQSFLKKENIVRDYEQALELLRKINIIDLEYKKSLENLENK